jgi:hypothetical protein
MICGRTTPLRAGGGACGAWAGGNVCSLGLTKPCHTISVSVHRHEGDLSDYGI